jgi:beta-phosphoglucomutase-like phosphatase (HAD superfamily)
VTTDPPPLARSETWARATIKAIPFDEDGTLFDFRSTWLTAYRGAAPTTDCPRADRQYPATPGGKRRQLMACRNSSSRKPSTRRALIAQATVSALAIWPYRGFSTFDAQRHTDTTIQTV